jgi:membrane glycosyltransferase
MILAPFVISWFSQDSRSGLMAVPSEINPAPVLRHHTEILRAWLGEGISPPTPPDAAFAGAARR